MAPQIEAPVWLGRPRRRTFLYLCVLAAWTAVALSANQARAQKVPDVPPTTDPDVPPAADQDAPAADPDAPIKLDETPEPAPQAPAKKEPPAPRAEPAPPVKTEAARPAEAKASKRPSTEELMRANPGAAPWARETGWYQNSTMLSWRGGLETDVGYAKYNFDTSTYRPEEFFDFRGRFVLGPDLRYDFAGGDYFVRATAEFVAWIREQYNIYQVNVDDAYAQVGKYGLWDFQIGRFMTWRVYRKGLGFDLFTLEQTGALTIGPFEGGRFGVQIYEVDNIFYRETPGRAAFHLYPTEWSGIELAGQYGKDGTANTAGVRGAGNVHFDFVSVTAGVEYRFFRPAVETSSTAPDGSLITCERCGIVKRYGYGGGAVFTLKPVEAGANAGKAFQASYAIKDGTPDKNAFFQTTSIGGYVQLDVGSLVVNRSLIIGGGLNRTERLYDNGNFERHVQGAAYIAFPLGFNNAMIKLVGSRADALVEEAGDGVTFLRRDSSMTAARVRLSFNF